MLGASIAGSLIPAIFGGVQARKAKKLAKNNIRPIKEVSESTRNLVNATRTQAGKYGFAGQAQQQAILDRQSAQAVRNLMQSGMSSNQIIGGIGNVDYNTKAAQEKMAIQAAAAKERNMGIYFNALQQQAAEEQSAWDYNKRQKYDENAAAISALTQSANANINTAFNTLAGGIYDYAAGTYDVGGRTNKTTTTPGGQPGVGDAYTPPKYSPMNINYFPPDNLAINSAPQQSQPQYSMDELRQIYNVDEQKAQLENLYGPLSDAQLRMFLTKGV